MGGGGYGIKQPESLSINTLHDVDCSTTYCVRLTIKIINYEKGKLIYCNTKRLACE